MLEKTKPGVVRLSGSRKLTARLICSPLGSVPFDGHTQSCGNAHWYYLLLASCVGAVERSLLMARFMVRFI